MSEGSSIIGFPRGKREKREDAPENPTEAIEKALITEPVTETQNSSATDAGASDFHYDVEPDRPTDHKGRWIASMCAIMAMAWIGFVGWLGWQTSDGAWLSAEQAGGLIAMASAPLALIGVLYLLLLRSSLPEQRRFQGIAAELRHEALALDQALAAISARLERDRAMLALHSDAIGQAGDGVTARLHATGEAVRADAALLERQAMLLKSAATQARSDMSVLLSGLPKAQAETRLISSDLKIISSQAAETVERLAAEIGALGKQGQAAGELADNAAKRLAEQSAAIHAASETARGQIVADATAVEAMIDGALTRAAEAVDQTRKAMDAQTAAMRAATEQGKTAIEEASARSDEALTMRFDDIDKRMVAFAKMIAQRESAARALFSELADGFSGVQTALLAIENDGTQRMRTLSDAIATLDQTTARLTNSLGEGETAAAALIERAETMLTALDANTREIEETLPNAIERLEQRAREGAATLADLLPRSGALEEVSRASVAHLTAARTMIDEQAQTTNTRLESMARQMQQLHDDVARFAKTVNDAGDDAARFNDGAGAQLVETLLRVRETATQASGYARDALDSIVAESAAALAKASKDAMAGAVSDAARSQIEQIMAASERAVEAARKATDRLMRQMLTIADTTAAVEKRIAETREDTQERERESFARRVSLLIESLNSAAIDVSKLLSNEVADNSWAAYLKGDRGVFTRRAVRLLDAAEARDILRHYDGEPEFRDHVNRYIHDFEAMLRSVLATPEGSTLGVTILSSDMGKLYVALSQAIERLRT